MGVCGVWVNLDGVFIFVLRSWPVPVQHGDPCQSRMSSIQVVVESGGLLRSFLPTGVGFPVMYLAHARKESVAGRETRVCCRKIVVFLDGPRATERDVDLVAVEA